MSDSIVWDLAFKLPRAVVMAWICASWPLAGDSLRVPSIRPEQPGIDAAGQHLDVPAQQAQLARGADQGHHDLRLHGHAFLLDDAMYELVQIILP